MEIILGTLYGVGMIVGSFLYSHYTFYSSNNDIDE